MTTKWDRERAVVGALVAVSSGWYGTPDLIPIERVTATQAILRGGHTRVRLSDGHIIGADTWSRTRAWLPDEAEITEIRDKRRHQDLVTRLRETNWAKVPLAQCEAVAAVLDAGDAK